MKPRVTVVIPAFNAAAFILDAVHSVRAQTIGEWELVVADDGSTDGTAALVESVDDERIRVLRLAHSGLPAVARNAALTESAAPNVAFLDADDVWLPMKLERQLALFAQRPDVGLVHTAAAYLDDQGCRIQASYPDDHEVFDRLLEENFIVNSSAVVRRSLLDEHGFFDPTCDLRGSEDYELWLRLASHTLFAVIDDPLVLYRRHGSNISSDRARMSVSALLARAKAIERTGSQRETPGYLRNLGIARCLAGLPGSGRRELARAVLGSPRDRIAWKWLLLSLIGARGVRRLRWLLGSGEATTP